MPRPERPFLVFLPTGEHPVQLKGRRQFFASIQNAFGFCQPVIPEHNEHNRQSTGAGVALVVRSVRVGICRLSEFAFSAQCAALLPYLLSPIGDRMQFTKINKSRHAAYVLHVHLVFITKYRKPILGFCITLPSVSVRQRFAEILVRN